MKKILSLVLAAMMIFSVLPAAFAAETAVAAEVSEDVVEAITLLNNLGIYKGYENGDMGADDLVQRYQMSIFATRFKSGRVDDKIWATTENDSGFTDVVDFAGASDYVLGMISYAAQAGIVNGTGDNKFEPTMYVKYKEAITMVVRALGQVYSAASYPWAYIQFANDAGLLDGIDTDIAPDDYVSRGVIAQLLYNALFVELVDEDGKDIPTVAEKNFGIGYTTVMVTASNNVVYEPAATTVLNTNKIRFAEVDAQGEPTGADYHADMALFGIADAKAADKAVGTLYNIYYKGNFTGILSAESLAVVYENRGWDKMTVKASDAKNYLGYMATDAYVTIDGTKYQVVDSYTSLKNKQGPKSDAAGTAEMKVFLENGAIYAVADLKPGYVLSSDGKYIYDLSATSNTFFTPVAYYSEIINQWYTVVDGNWVIVPASKFFYGFGGSVAGFGQQLDASAASAYANITVSANERMTIREYRFGKMADYDSATRVDMYGNAKSGVTTFSVSYAREDYTTGTLVADTTPYLLYGTETTYSEYLGATDPIGARPVQTDEYFVDEYRWTGLQKSQIKEGAYMLFYIDHENMEIDVLEVIDASKDGDDSYTVTGYIRGFDIANNSLTFGDNYDTYYYDYDSLSGATIYSAAKNTTAYQNGDTSKDYTTLNYNFLSGLYNVAVTLVVVDGKVVHITKNSTSDFVIIDSFVSFEEDGIIANAWTTAENGYTQIKIASFNGWSVGGIDYWYYFMSQYVGTASVYNLPFTTYELYSVMSYANGVYDLTVCAAEVDDKNLGLNVNGYGYIEHVDKNGSWSSSKYTVADNSHYWMILDKSDTTNKKVYSLNGKINPVSFATTAQFYKVKSGDYVIVVDSAADMSALDFLSGNIAFYKYNTVVNQYDNQNYYLSDGFDSYNYTLLMTNVLTGKTETVKLGNDSLLGTQGYNAYQMYAAIKEQDGAIFKAEDGVITDVTKTYKVAQVAEHYATKVNEYTKADLTVIENVNGKTAAALRTTLTRKMASFFMPSSDAASVASLYNSKITFVYEYGTAFRSFSSSQTGNAAGGYGVLYNSVVADFDALLAQATTMYNAYFVINEKDQTATVWVVSTGLSFAKAPKAVTVTGIIDDGNSTPVANYIVDATKDAVKVSVALNEVTDKMTVTIDLTNVDLTAATTDTFRTGYAGVANFAPNVTPTVGTDGMYDKLVVVVDEDAYVDGDLVVVVNRDGQSKSELRFTVTIDAQ